MLLLQIGQPSALVVGIIVVAAALAAVGVTFFARRSTDAAEQRYHQSLSPAVVATTTTTTEGGGEGGLRTRSVAAIAANADPEHQLAALPAEYHSQVLAQSRQSFIFSIGAAVVGLFVIVVAILLVLSGHGATGVTSMIGGAISETVPVLFFSQSNKARKLMAGQLDGFRAAAETAREARERRELIQMVKDPIKRDELIAETVLVLAQQRPARRHPGPHAEPGHGPAPAHP